MSGIGSPSFHVGYHSAKMASPLRFMSRANPAASISSDVMMAVCINSTPTDAAEIGGRIGWEGQLDAKGVWYLVLRNAWSVTHGATHDKTGSNVVAFIPRIQLS